MSKWLNVQTHCGKVPKRVATGSKTTEPRTEVWFKAGLGPWARRSRAGEQEIEIGFERRKEERNDITEKGKTASTVPHPAV